MSVKLNQMDRANGQTATTNISSTMGAKNNQAVLTLEFMY
jgi:hypothetical protein